MDLVAYLRVSSESQVDGFGLQVQERAVRSWAKANGHRVVEVFTDAGVSGVRDAVDRPGLSAALDALRPPPRGRGLVVARLDRLARALHVQEIALHVQEIALQVAWRAGACVFTADSGEVLADDPDDPGRTFVRQIMGGVAQLERALIVKRMRDGRKAKAATGRKSAGSYAYGYTGAGKGRDRDAAPREEEQRAVRRILDLRADGQSYREIAAALDVEGLPPRRALSWSAMAVRNVALREQAII